MRRRWFAGSVAVVFLGCGLADYESHIEKQKNRLARVDEENKLLGEPLEMPKRIAADKSESDGLPAEFFLRGPKEISREAEPTPWVYPPKKAEHQVTLYRFPLQKSDKIDDGSPEKKDFLFHALLLTTAPLAEDKLKEGREEFRRNVLGAMMIYLSASELPLEKATWKKHPALPSFDALEFPGGLVKDKTKKGYHSFFYLYLHEQEYVAEARKVQAAIVFQVPFDKKADEKMLKVRDLTLRSLGLGDEQRNRADLYARWRR